MTQLSVPNVPLSPSQAKALQHEAIPAVVFEEVNRFISLSLHNGRATVSVPDLRDAIVARIAGMPEHAHITRKQDLPAFWTSPENIRRTYGPAGWDVRYDCPAYFESGEATFHFAELK